MVDLRALWPGLQPADERTGLNQRLDYCRAAVLTRIVDLDDYRAASRPLLPGTSLSVGGIVKHLASVEDLWLHQTFGGLPTPEPWHSAPWADEPDWAMESAQHDTVADLVALYEAACGRSRATAAASESLDMFAALPMFGPDRHVNLRWILVHMVDETAWHLGHLDMLRDALGVPNAR